MSENKDASICSKNLWKKKYEHKYFNLLTNYNGELRDIFFYETVEILNKNFDKLFFISGGTLLGFIREKDFIQWDDNIDLSFSLENDSFFKLQKLQSIFINKNYVARIFSKQNYLKISLYKYGYKIDFTSIFKIKKYYHSNLYKFPCDCLDEFKEVDFKNVQVKIPIKYEKYLTFLYGNWKSPKKDNYATIKSTRIIHYKYIISQLLHYLKLK